MKKQFVCLSMLFVLVFVIAGCGGSETNGTGEADASSDDIYELKLHHDLAADSPQHLGAEKFKELVEEKTNGRVEVKLFPSGQLGDDVEVTELIQSGSVEAGLIPTAKLSTFDASMQLPDLPFIFPSREAAYEVLDGEVGQELLAGLADIGITGASFWESGFKQFTNNEKIEKPSDFEGLKIRTMESPIVIEQFKALGANPVPISFAETYNSLQQNVVEGQENPLVSIVKMKFYEVQNYTILSNHGYLAYAFLLSKDWFEGLPEDIQTVILESSQEAAEFEREETIAQEEDFIKTIEDYGTEVYELTDKQLAVFQEETKSVHEQFADEIGPDLLDKTYEIVESVEK
ncbi:TRAP transporter substrate-binding protein [Gracilibacillus caseinilyticus]|uniref:TRAP transporter substrate-binding protein n=1 Tax=Gracilibacillus caseinilyticus TaxID=2932256 RepID=A0ABY4F444_9BACI|nr:TRAP transporter substrate-binding protein [Gracilibacillus caseinilyticus]UOQ49241.1 TRAP transporter substrate-binding protein [Gracilibacillus caseinilyticus]